MGKSSPTPPPAPDPVATALAQAQANRIAQFTPQGSLQYGRVGPDGGFVLDPTLSDAATRIVETPYQQALREARQQIGQTLANQALLRAKALAGSPRSSTYGLPELPTDFIALDQSTAGLPALPTDFEGTRKRAEHAAYQRALNLLNPELDRQERRLRQDLANRGQPISDGAAGGSEFSRYLDAANRAREDAALAAVIQGGSEADRQVAQAAAARQQMLNELSLRFGQASATRQQQFNELAALLGGQQVAPVALPSFAPPPPVDVLGAQALAQRNQLAGYNAAAQQAQGAQQGLFGLASEALPFVLKLL